MNEDLKDLAVRVAALEKMVVHLQRSTQEPLLALIDWMAKDQVNDLGRTRGKLLALEAFARAAAGAAPDRPALAAAFAREIELAEADVLVLRVPDAALGAARVGLQETIDALQRELTPPAL